MKIEIKLSPKEAVGIIIEHFQPMFPGKFIEGDLSSYAGVELEILDEKPKEEVGNGEPK